MAFTEQAGEGDAPWRFLQFIFPSAGSGSWEGIQAHEEAVDSNSDLKNTDLCCSDTVRGLKFRECISVSTASHTLPHPGQSHCHFTEKETKVLSG